MPKIKLNIAQTIDQLLTQEDIDNDKRITIDDAGPKLFYLENGAIPITVQGTYYLSNLLQELVLALEKNLDFIEIDNVFELPANRLSRMIQTYFWDGLTRTLDAAGLEKTLVDTKSKASQQLIYIPFSDNAAWEYYGKLSSKFNLKPIRLPQTISSEYVDSINDAGGVLSLKLVVKNNEIIGVPFVVPGGRFNEMYGWDSYFENIGLLLDQKFELAKAMVDNFEYQIVHYGKILNANRSYYLTRTQPPFFSSMIREVFEQMPIKNLDWLRQKLSICIHEYESVWMKMDGRLAQNGLNRYFADGQGLPPETEPGHYNDILKPFAMSAGLSIANYEKKYYKRQIQNTILDDYFVHDRCVRESGHDTTYRLEGVCADLNVVELNAMLFKYETDFADLISIYFDNNFVQNNLIYNRDYWISKSEERKTLMNNLLWNDAEKCFFDYNFKTKKQNNFLSATCFFPLWAKCASQAQADLMVTKHLPKLIFKGGLAACSKDALKHVPQNAMKRQWDFPNGWPPHQIIIWQGLINYGYDDLSQELIYRWLLMITQNACDYNGTVPEKYDVELASHKVFAEYGNQGIDFEYISKEGFGWMNASFQLGMKLLRDDLKVKLNKLVPFEDL